MRYDLTRRLAAEEAQRLNAQMQAQAGRRGDPPGTPDAGNRSTTEH